MLEDGSGVQVDPTRRIRGVSSKITTAAKLHLGTTYFVSLLQSH